MPGSLWIRSVSFALFLCCISVSTPALALMKNAKTRFYLEKSRAAWSIGKLGAWGQSLTMAEAAYAQEKQRMSEDEKSYYQLWLYLFRSKWHQHQGMTPVIKNIEQFENKKELSSHIKRWEKAVQHLQQGYHLFKKYNFLYSQISDKAKISNRLYIQASLSQERDLLGHVQLGQVYIALLRFARQYSKDRAKVKSRIRKQSGTVKRLLEEQVKVRLKQRHLVKAVVQAQQHYKQAQYHLERQSLVSQQLIRSSIPLLVLGVAGLSVGIPMALFGATLIPEPDGFGNEQAWSNRINRRISFLKNKKQDSSLELQTSALLSYLMKPVSKQKQGLF